MPRSHPERRPGDPASLTFQGAPSLRPLGASIPGCRSRAAPSPPPRRRRRDWRGVHAHPSAGAPLLPPPPSSPRTRLPERRPSAPRPDAGRSPECLGPDTQRPPANRAHRPGSPREGVRAPADRGAGRGGARRGSWRPARGPRGPSRRRSPGADGAHRACACRRRAAGRGLPGRRGRERAGPQRSLGPKEAVLGVFPGRFPGGCDCPARTAGASCESRVLHRRSAQNPVGPRRETERLTARPVASWGAWPGLPGSWCHRVPVLFV